MACLGAIVGISGLLVGLLLVAVGRTTKLWKPQAALWGALALVVVGLVMQLASQLREGMKKKAQRRRKTEHEHMKEADQETEEMKAVKRLGVKRDGAKNGDGYAMKSAKPHQSWLAALRALAGSCEDHCMAGCTNHGYFTYKGGTWSCTDKQGYAINTKYPEGCQNICKNQVEPVLHGHR